MCPSNSPRACAASASVSSITYTYSRSGGTGGDHRDNIHVQEKTIYRLIKLFVRSCFCRSHCAVYTTPLALVQLCRRDVCTLGTGKNIQAHCSTAQTICLPKPSFGLNQTVKNQPCSRRLAHDYPVGQTRSPRHQLRSTSLRPSSFMFMVLFELIFLSLPSRLMPKLFCLTAASSRRRRQAARSSSLSLSVRSRSMRRLLFRRHSSSTDWSQESFSGRGVYSATSYDMCPKLASR